MSKACTGAHSPTMETKERRTVVMWLHNLFAICVVLFFFFFVCDKKVHTPIFAMNHNCGVRRKRRSVTWIGRVFCNDVFIEAVYRENTHLCVCVFLSDSILLHFSICESKKILLCSFFLWLYISIGVFSVLDSISVHSCMCFQTTPYWIPFQKNKLYSFWLVCVVSEDNYRPFLLQIHNRALVHKRTYIFFILFAFSVFSNVRTFLLINTMRIDWTEINWCVRNIPFTVRT